MDAQQCERRSPDDDLAEHRVEGAPGALARNEGSVVLELRPERQCDLRAHIGQLQLAGDEPQVLDRPVAARAEVRHEADRLVVPLVVEEVDGVLQRAGRRVVALRVIT